MDTQQNTESRLWDYIDGLSSPQEQSAIEAMLSSNLEWKSKYHELLEAHQLLKSTELEEPSMRFTKNVMEEIAKYHIAPAAKSYINKKIIWSIGGFFITLILAFTIYGIAQVDWSAPTDTSNLPIDINKIDFSKIFNNTFVNVFMMLNVVLGLMLLDRYLANQRKQIHKKA
ncbi:MAG: hypothetical protein GC171_02730 [Terrimonas sp.]|nr:hypothetical protein [Terrimonas sp.]